MTSMTVGPDGGLTLPAEVQEHYRLTPETPIRIIETRSGILLVPLTDAPMDGELAQELTEWQSLAQETWAAFPYDDKEAA